MDLLESAGNVAAGGSLLNYGLPVQVHKSQQSEDANNTRPGFGVR
jgi:hypothetical protein